MLELARQIDRSRASRNSERGITVNPGVISGGTRSNVVAAEARVEVDIRVLRLQDAPALEKKFRALRPFDKRCTIEVTRRIEPAADGAVARDRGAVPAGRRGWGGRSAWNSRNRSTGGGSDGNFTAALGVPTLDGLGAVGEGAHAANESILVDRMADRTAIWIAEAAGVPVVADGFRPGGDWRGLRLPGWRIRRGRVWGRRRRRSWRRCRWRGRGREVHRVGQVARRGRRRAGPELQATPPEMIRLRAPIGRRRRRRG